MSMTSLLRALMEPSPQGMPESTTSDPLSTVLGNLLGQNRAGGQMQTQVGLVLGALETLLGFQPGTNSMQGAMGATAMDETAIQERLMPFLQPTVDRLSQKANIEPQAATAIVSLALHYMLSSHPASGRNGALELTNLMEGLKSGSLDLNSLHTSGIVEDLMQATGTDRETALRNLDAVFGVLSEHIRGA